MTNTKSLNQIALEFVRTLYADAPTATATVYVNGKEEATYSRDIAILAAEDMHGDAVDDTTGEIIYSYALTT